MFECLCFRDLRAYSRALGGYTAYYRDRYGLEADCVLHLEDGRYALIEFKLGLLERREVAGGLVAKGLTRCERDVRVAPATATHEEPKSMHGCSDCAGWRLESRGVLLGAPGLRPRALRTAPAASTT